MKRVRNSFLLIISLLFVLTIFDGTKITLKAAQTAELTTVMDCSVWSQPSTNEAYRVKKIPAGYKVTVYTTPVQSINGDGKTYYMTIKGKYILCKCFGDVNVNSSNADAGSSSYSGYTKLIMSRTGSGTAYSTDEAIKLVRDAMNHHNEVFTLYLGGGLSLSDAYYAVYYDMQDNLDNCYGQVELEMASFSYSYAKKQIDFTFSYLCSLEQAQAMEDKFFETLPYFCTGTDFDKIMAVHDYLCNSITYINDGTNLCHTAYCGLLKGYGVCQSYASLFTKYMQALGIPCVAAEGIVDGGRHQWNIVKLGGQWYHIDATWDDSVSYVSRQYFLIGSGNAGYSTWGNCNLKITIAASNYRY